MATIRQKVVAKMNEGQEPDTKPFTWGNTPISLRIFWMRYFREQENAKFANN